MTFDSVILAAVAHELNKQLTDGRVEMIHQPAPLDIVIGIRSKGADHSLLISAQAHSPRVHLTAIRRPNPKSPPNFCMLMRKHLRGARLSGVEQMDFDRIAHIGFHGFEGRPLKLIVEIMGKHSNVVLVDEAGRILGAIKPIGKSKNRYREILPGKEYVAPPSQGKLNPLQLTADGLREIVCGSSLRKSAAEPEQTASWLSKTFTGISAFAARELTARAGDDLERLPEVFEEFFGKIRTGQYSPVLITSDSGQTEGFYPFPTASYPPSNQHERSSISTAADVYYASALPRVEFEQVKKEFMARVRKELESKEHTLHGIESGLSQCENAERFKQIGELILAQLSTIPHGAEQAVLEDYYSPAGGQLTVELDPKLGPAENAENYFRRYQKGLSGQSALKDRLSEVRAEVKLLRRVSDSADSVLTEEQIRSLTAVLESQGIRMQRQEAAESAGRKIEFEGYRISRVMSTGWEILVGENSEANDYLLTRVARPNDYWVHVKASPSAHVIIRTNGKPESVPQAVIHAAAELAVRHSSSKHSSLVPVDYTLRKYVRKPKGAPAGKALYQNEKTVYITPKA